MRPRVWAAVVAAVVMGCSGPPAAPPPKADSPDAVKAREQELKAARQAEGAAKPAREVPDKNPPNP